MATFPGYSWLLNTTKLVFGRIVQTGPVPKHVGLIMDGNRRYARIRNIELKEGHNMGFESMASILEVLYECGVECATVYAFLIENFKRLSYEVKWLMDLAKQKFQQITQHGELCEQYGVRIKVLGNLSMLQPDVLRLMKQAEETTKNNKRATLNVCFPYTARDEITNLIKQIVRKSARGEDFIIDESCISDFLYTRDSPPLELLVRTSGTYRLSDFLLWQCVSSDCSIVITDTLWPEFTPYHMAKILIHWGFNKYWYGNANGYALNPHPRNRRIGNDYDINDADEDRDNSDNSDQDSTERIELDTVTSIESISPGEIKVKI